MCFFARFRVEGGFRGSPRLIARGRTIIQIPVCLSGFVAAGEACAAAVGSFLVLAFAATTPGRTKPRNANSAAELAAKVRLELRGAVVIAAATDAAGAAGRG